MLPTVSDAGTLVSISGAVTALLTSFYKSGTKAQSRKGVPYGVAREKSQELLWGQ